MVVGPGHGSGAHRRGIIYRKILSILKPFLIAGFIAYILNFLMEIFENLLFKLKYFQNDKKKKIARYYEIGRASCRERV